MAEHERLTKEQKNDFNRIFIEYGESYELDESGKLNEEFEKAAEGLEYIKPSAQHIFVSRPEVHPQIWNALIRSGIGKPQQFDNGDSDPEYNKAAEVEKNLLEALLALLVRLIEALTKAVTGRTGGSEDDWSSRASRKPRRAVEDGYDR